MSRAYGALLLENHNRGWSILNATIRNGSNVLTPEIQHFSFGNTPARGISQSDQFVEASPVRK
jgi:hypothetical protein